MQHGFNVLVAQFGSLLDAPFERLILMPDELEVDAQSYLAHVALSSQTLVAQPPSAASFLVQAFPLADAAEGGCATIGKQCPRLNNRYKRGSPERSPREAAPQ